MVASWIAGDKMDPDEAGKKFVDENPDVVNQWLQ
jgi:ABC-type proline/glycine betaine transport system substrate-binding protein